MKIWVSTHLLSENVSFLPSTSTASTEQYIFFATSSSVSLYAPSFPLLFLYALSSATASYWAFASLSFNGGDVCLVCPVLSSTCLLILTWICTAALNHIVQPATGIFVFVCVLVCFGDLFCTILCWIGEYAHCINCTRWSGIQWVL